MNPNNPTHPAKGTATQTWQLGFNLLDPAWPNSVVVRGQTSHSNITDDSMITQGLVDPARESTSTAARQARNIPTPAAWLKIIQDHRMYQKAKTLYTQLRQQAMGTANIYMTTEYVYALIPIKSITIAPTFAQPTGWVGIPRVSLMVFIAPLA